MSAKFTPDPEKTPEPTPIPKPPHAILRVEDRLGIRSTVIGSVWQDDREWSIRTAIVEVTPALAKVFLSYRVGTRQRNLKHLHFGSLTRDMKADRFLFTGQPIIFSEDGNLDDGQHRCHACIASGKSFVCLVVFGVPNTSYVALDVTARRTVADTMRMDDTQSPVASGSVGKWVYQWEVGDFVTNVTITPIEGREIIDGHPGLNESVIKTGKYHKIFIYHHFVAFCHYIASQIDREDADYFIDQVATLVGHEEGSPMLKFRQYLDGVREAKNKGKLEPRRQLLGHFIKAWNHFRKGEKISRLKFRPEEDLPKLI